MLGPELETFKGNKVVMGLMVFLALGVFVLGDFIATRPFSDITVGGRIFMLSFIIWPIFLFFWVNSVRVIFHTDGISYRSLFGEKEIRWDALVRFEYGAVKQLSNPIPSSSAKLWSGSTPVRSWILALSASAGSGS